jgi:hypothetical protein
MADRSISVHLDRTASALDAVYDHSEEPLTNADRIAIAQVRATLALAVAVDNLTDYSRR